MTVFCGICDGKVATVSGVQSYQDATPTVPVSNIPEMALLAQQLASTSNGMSTDAIPAKPRGTSMGVTP